MRKRSILLINTLVIFVFLVSSYGCSLQDNPSKPTSYQVEQTGDIAYDDILKMETLNRFELSPNGKHIVYMKSCGTDLAPPENKGELVQLDIKTRTERMLNDSSESVISWALSPDGLRLAYVGMNKAARNYTLHIVNTQTRDNVLLKDVPEKIYAGFKWLATDKLVFLGTDPHHVPENLPGNVIIMDEISAPVILKSYSLEDGSVELLTDNSDVIYEYEPSPDGKHILYKASAYPEVWLETPTFRYVLLETSTKKEDELMVLEEGYQDENEFAWSADSSRVYIERMQNGGLHYPVRYTSDIIYYDIATRQIEEMPLQWKRKLLKDLFTDDIEITPFDKGVYALLADGTNPKLARYTLLDSGWKKEVLKGEHQGNIYALESSPDGSVLYYNFNSASLPPQVYKGEVRGAAIVKTTKLTRLNERLLEKDLGSSEVVTWKGVNGDEIQAVLRYPPGYKPGKPYPAVFVIHGGPTYTDFDGWRDTWEFPYHLITNLGAVLVSVNYHGSSNFGFEFAQSIEGGHYYDYPIEDFMKGVQALADKGIINPDKLGITGWSNGGLLSLYWVTQDPTLKAAVVGAGTADENGQVAFTNGIVMNLMYHDKTPFEDPQAYIRMMGEYNAENVRTPVLMFSGTNDQSVVSTSVMSTYRAYKKASQSGVKLMLFPGEPHHLSHYENQLRKVMEEVKWLSQIL